MAGQTLTFTLEGRDRLSKVLDGAGNSAGKMATKLTAATGAIPAAAALAPFIAGTGAAAVAVGAFSVALIPQIAKLGEASSAQKKYEQAVQQSGARSEAAVTAQTEYRRQLAAMPPATREAAMALEGLKDQTDDWSDSLSDSTMPVFTKGIAVAGAALPKLTGLVKGAGVELDRTMTIAGGAMETPGLDRANKKFTAFATGSLQKANDALVHLSRTANTGEVGGSYTKFMAYASAQGPLVADTFKNIAAAALTILQAGSETGIGVLQLANGLAKVVASMPPGFIALLLQASVAIRAVRLAIGGVQLAAGAFVLVRAQIAAAGTAAIGTTGMISTLRTAFMALSLAARTAVAATGIGLLLIGLMELSNIGKKAPTDIDKMSSSLGKFAISGKLAGEAAKSSGRDFGELDKAMDGLKDPSGFDKFLQGWANFIGTDSTKVKEFKSTIDDVDKGLAGLVKNGHADLAAAALKGYEAHLESTGHSSKDLTKHLGDYKSALADQAYEAKLAAQAQGLFGTQAQQVKTKLDAQKASADGLRQSIQALNDVNRAGLSGMIGFEAAIDAAAKAAKDNGRSLHMVGGELDLTSEKARSNATALSDLGAKTDAAASQAREGGASWSTVNGIYARGRSELVKTATQMGLTGSQASALADKILKIPSKTVQFKGAMEDLQAKITSAQGKVNSLKQKRATALGAEKKRLDSEVTAAQRRVNALKQQKAIALLAVDKTGAAVARARSAIASLRDRRINLTSVFKTEGTPSAGFGVLRAAGGIVRRAAGGPVGGFPGGGPVSGPGTSTSDSILTRLSNNEFVIKAKSVAKYGLGLMNALNDGTLQIGSGLGSSGGMSGAGAQAAAGLAAGLTGSTSTVDAAARTMAAAVSTGVRAELEIASPSKKTKALAADAGNGMIVGLTGTKAKITAVAKDLVKDIWAAWKGSKSTRDSSLVRMVNKDTAKLQTLATKRDKLAATIATAKAYQTELQNNARQGAELSNLGMEPDQVTAGGIKGGLAAKLAEIKTFSDRIYALSKKGLNKGLLRQILNMGPEAGGAYASALMGADKSTFASINSLQSQLDKSTATLGRVGADAMYDSGAQAGHGFLVGLTTQQKAIEKKMTDIAKGMQKAIKKALGIKSPSRVMAEIGQYSTQGLAAGLTEALPHVDQALATVSGRVAGTRPVMGAPAYAMSTTRAGGGPTVIEATFNITSMDPIATAREVRRVLLELKRVQGVNVNLGVA